MFGVGRAETSAEPTPPPPASLQFVQVWLIHAGRIAVIRNFWTMLVFLPASFQWQSNRAAKWLKAFRAPREADSAWGQLVHASGLTDSISTPEISVHPFHTSHNCTPLNCSISHWIELAQLVWVGYREIRNTRVNYVRCFIFHGKPRKPPLCELFFFFFFFKQKFILVKLVDACC